MSLPPENPGFRRVWTGPPLIRERAAPHHQGRPNLGNLSNSNDPISPAADPAQRACTLAARRAAQLEHRAGALVAIGRGDAAVLREVAG